MSDRDSLLVGIQTKLYKKRIQHLKLVDLLPHFNTETLDALNIGLDTIQLNTDKINKALYLFTDGACSKNGKVGAKASWACFITNDVSHKYYNLNMCGMIEKEGTNQKAELTGILNALEIVKAYKQNIDEKEIVICTDSLYSINCCTKWFKAWEKNHWKNAKNQDVKNPELIKGIINLIKELSATHTISFKHVYSHTSKPKSEESFDYFIWYGNDKVDKMATELLAKN